MKKICVFDVNETLLDLAILDPEFKRIFGDESVRQLWFAQFIQSAMVSIITNSYKPFGQIASSSLSMVAEKLKIELSDIDKRSILSLVPKLPAHPDAVEGIKFLKEAGFTIVALTNSTHEVVSKQLNNAGISQYFDEIISAESVEKLKPAREPYEYVANTLSVTAADLILIAAHGWDIAGAKSAGYRTAFIARPGAVIDEINGAPDIVGSDLIEVSKQILSIRD